MRKVGRKLFCAIVGKPLSGDVKQRACVDYKLHALVYENNERLRRIIDNHVNDRNRRTELKTQLEGVREYLKYRYITHLINT